MKGNEQNHHAAQIWKRQYSTPKIIVYGNIAEVTKSVTGTGNMDNPTGSSKTG